MLHHPTLDQLRHLKLHGMARAFAMTTPRPANSTMLNGWPCCSTEKRPNARPAIDLQARQRIACAIRTPHDR